MIDAMQWELKSRSEFITEPIETIYFGGGTPSVLSAEEIGAFIELAKSENMLSGAVEITLEANPDDLTLPYLEGLKRVGVNRLSIGVQSLPG